MCSTLPNPTTTITPFQMPPQGKPNHGSVLCSGESHLQNAVGSIAEKLNRNLLTAFSTDSNQSSRIGVSTADDEPVPLQSPRRIVADFVHRIHYAQELAKQDFPVDSVAGFASFLQDRISLRGRENKVVSWLINHSPYAHVNDALSINFSQLERNLNTHIDREVLQGMANLLGCSSEDLLKHEVYKKLAGSLALSTKNESPDKMLKTVLDCVKEYHDQNTSIVFNQLKEFDSHCSHFFCLNNANQGDIAAFKKTYPIFRKKIFDLRCEILAFQQSFVTAVRKGCFVDAGAASKAIYEKIKLMKQNLGQIKQAYQRANHEYRVGFWLGVSSQLSPPMKDDDTESKLFGSSEEGDDHYSLSELSVGTEVTDSDECNSLPNQTLVKETKFAKKIAACCGLLKIELCGRISNLISRIASLLGQFFRVITKSGV